MDINQRKEQFSLAYVRAIAAAAGFSTARPEVDDDSIDLGISAKSGILFRRAPRLELQAKCTARSPLRADEETFSFQLKLKNYDDLRNEVVMVPRILVVMLVPAIADDWCQHHDDRTVLMHTAYWVSLRNRPETTNETSVSVSIAKAQQFTVASLQALMDGIQEERMP
jgi:hypothetical protein